MLFKVMSKFKSVISLLILIIFFSGCQTVKKKTDAVIEKENKMLSEYIGHEQIMTFDYENQEVLAKFPSTIKIELSKNTKLYFDLTQISLFDAKTEERI